MKERQNAIEKNTRNIVKKCNKLSGNKTVYEG
jgi:hypothetical protein